MKNNRKEIGSRIEEVRKKRKMSVRELSKRTGIGNTTLGRYEKGEHDIPINKLDIIANSLNTSVYFLMYGDDEREEDKFTETIKNVTGIDLILLEKSIKNEPNFRGVVKGFLGIDEDDVKIPLFSSISCGNLQSIDNILVDHVNVPKRLKTRFGEDLFSVRVKGDSMNNVILGGSIAVLSKSTEVKNGDVVAVLINGEEATMKRITKTNYAIVLEPDSSNPEHTPIFVDCVKENCNDVQVLGKLIYSFNEFE